MTELKIYTNSMNEIKALYYTDDPTLKEYTIDRDRVFGTHTDAYILGYKYEPVYDDVGNMTDAVVAPYLDLATLSAAEAGTKQAVNEVNPTIIVNHSTLADLIAFHVKALGRVGSELIEKGFDLGTDHYSLTSQDQTNIAALTLQCSTNARNVVVYHPDGQNCRVYSAEEMIMVSTYATAYVTYHTTRMNQLFQMVRSCTTKKQVQAITYKTPLSSENQATFEEIMQTMGITDDLRAYLDSTIELARDVTGEIRSTEGSVIDVATYETEQFVDFENATVTTDTDNVTHIVLPTLFVDPEYLNETTTEIVANAVYNVLTNVENTVTETWDSGYQMIYTLNEDGTSCMKTDIPNPVVLSVVIAANYAYNEETDKKSQEEKFYVIKTADSAKITQDYTDVETALGITHEEPTEEPTDESEVIDPDEGTSTDEPVVE